MKSIQQEILCNTLAMLRSEGNKDEKIRGILSDIRLLFNAVRTYIVHVNESNKIECLYESTAQTSCISILQDMSETTDIKTLIKQEEAGCVIDASSPKLLAIEQARTATPDLTSVYYFVFPHSNNYLAIDFCEYCCISRDDYDWLISLCDAMRFFFVKNSSFEKDVYTPLLNNIHALLNSTISFSELLYITEDIEEKKKYMELLYGYNFQLNQLINYSINILSIQRNELKLYTSDADINTIFQKIKTSIKKDTNVPTGILLSFETSADTCVLTIDANRLQQAIEILLNNAFLFAKEGSIRMSYSVSKPLFSITICHLGKYPKVEQPSQLFSYTANSESTHSEAFLGWNLCILLLKTMNGTLHIKYDEQLNETTITLTFPGTIVKKYLKSTSDSAKEESGTKLPKILIAEDNEFNYKYIEIILRNEYELYHAWNGQEAVELYKEHHPKIVLMDVKMPVMDGYAATNAIREISTDVPIIAITAYSFADDEQRLLASGFTSYISKPIDVKLLKKRMEDFLNQSNE